MEGKIWLRLIIGLFVALGLTYALVIPVFEASDELWHYPMIRHLADGNPLPVQVFDAAEAGPWKQEASQPPLYYYLAAALTFWIDTSDMEMVRWENPHVDNGVLTNDGNNNLIVHDPSLNPWQGTLLAVRIIRVFSVFLGAVTVYLTYMIANTAVPTKPHLALGATAVTAFIPMFLFISGAVNNDNLIVPLAALALLIMIRAVSRGPLPIDRELVVDDEPRTTDYGLRTTNHDVQTWLLLGFVIGFASLTKLSGIGLLPLAWGTIWVTRWQVSDRRVTGTAVFRWFVETTLRWLLVLLPVLLVAGWWYWRNIELYGDWRGWSAFIAVLGQRAHPASLRQLWAERWGFMLSYWGLFGGVNIPMWMWIYRLLNAVATISVFGFVVYLAREMRQWRLITKLTANMSLATTVAAILDLVVDYFPIVVSLLWAGAVVYGIVDWATITWSSQGRLVFSALPSLSLLLILGLAGWLPKRPSRTLVCGLSGFMFVVAALAPFLWIRPAYQISTDEPQFTQLAAVNFNKQIELGRYSVHYVDEGETAVSPGDSVWVELEWNVLQPMTRNWSVFVHLNDPVLGQPIAQRDMYLGQGLVATSFLQPGDRIVNRYELTLPETAVAPANLELVVGLYDFHTWERVPTSVGDEFVVLDSVMMEAVPGKYPNPVHVNFEDQFMLVGFEISPRRVQSGETANVTLYWKVERPLDTDYTFFAQVVDDDTTRWAAHDLTPTVKTSEWLPGDVQAITMNLTLRDDTPTAVYPIIIGIYTQTTDGQFIRLQTVTEDGRPTDDFLTLTLLRVE